MLMMMHCYLSFISVFLIYISSDLMWTKVDIKTFSFTLNRNPGDEGADPELPWKKRRSLWTREARTPQWPSVTCMLACLWLTAEIRQELWWSHHMLQKCTEKRQRQHPDPSGSLTAPNTDEGLGRVQGKHSKSWNDLLFLNKCKLLGV